MDGQHAGPGTLHAGRPQGEQGYHMRSKGVKGIQRSPGCWVRGGRAGRWAGTCSNRQAKQAQIPPIHQRQGPHNPRPPVAGTPQPPHVPSFCFQPQPLLERGACRRREVGRAWGMHSVCVFPLTWVCDSRLRWSAEPRRAGSPAGGAPSGAGVRGAGASPAVLDTSGSTNAEAAGARPGPARGQPVDSTAGAATSVWSAILW